MDAPEHAMFLPPRGCQGPPNAHVDKARRVLWQQFRQGDLAHDQLAHEVVNVECERVVLAHLLRVRPPEPPVASEAVWTAQTAIWHLFEAGLIDDGSATVVCLQSMSVSDVVQPRIHGTSSPDAMAPQRRWSLNERSDE